MRLQTLFFAFIAWLFVACSSAPAHPNIRRVDAAEFAHAIGDTTTIVLDVRTPKEHAAGAISTKDLNINVMSDDFEERIRKELPKGATIAIYCRSGNRSQKAAKILSENGFHVVELSTGYKGWMAHSEK